MDTLSEYSLPVIKSFDKLFDPQPDYPYFQRAHEAPFEAGSITHSATNGWWCAELSLLSYVQQPKVVAGILQEASFDTTDHFEEKGTVAFIASNPNVVMVVFRGTEVNDVNDLKADLDLRSIPSNIQGNAHSGFSKALDSVWKDLNTRLSELMVEKRRPVWFCGHSLGGALAILAAGRFPTVQGVYTYGTPRCGDDEYGASYPHHVYRYVNNNDLVPQVVPSALFMHVGDEYVFDASGELHHAFEGVSRWLSYGIGYVQAWSASLKNILSKDRVFPLGAGIEDHSPLVYAFLARKALLKSIAGSDPLELQWRPLIHKTNLSESELVSIPASTCASNISIYQYFEKHLGLSEEDMLSQLHCEKKQFMDPSYWLNATDELTFHKNILNKCPTLFTHRDFVEVGKEFSQSPNTLFLMFIKLRSIQQLFKESSRIVRQFNNQYEIKAVSINSGFTTIIIRDFPWYSVHSMGHECRFVQGVLGANFSMHGVEEYHIRHRICGKKVKDIVERVYGKQGWSYREDQKDVYINDQKIGKKVRLKRRRLGGELIPTVKVDMIYGELEATLIENTFTHNGVVIFEAGEIYDAPCCVLDVQWNPLPLFQRMINAVRVMMEVKPHLLKNTQDQLELTRNRLFEVREAFNEMQKKTEIYKVYTRPSLVDIVEEGGDPRTTPAKQIDATILFSDIRSFTTLVENMDAMDVVRLLDAYYETVNGAILENGGEIDKLIGDGIMAIFSDAKQSVKAAVEIKRRMQNFNRERYTQGLPIVHSGIGICSGPVVMGNIGSLQKKDYTVVGKSVNNASRLEGISKHYGVGIVVSQETRDIIGTDHSVRFLDRVQFKGKSDPGYVYEVFDHEPDEILDKKIANREKCDEAFQEYSICHFDKANSVYTLLQKEMGPHRYLTDRCADPAIQFYTDRCSNLQKQLSADLLVPEQFDGIQHYL